ncbi:MULTISPECIES: helix-turn-helix domain-containing protein [Pseudomonas putida group]|uniref:helix-turn-helix domain-containing protein n=1 Tax=Pseudomonas TaxID=286 RepID=UPI0015753CE6|nr:MULTISPECIES: helix-turn-helix transcriptional regulator [Pseudomonas putida group]NTY91175.1 helix-turn-helix transcriptional regulator [Pseudomonas putida]NTY99124.1 helix-turn-helix transcriptional regulator [Pseudomonas putida]NTZ21421.1 helix-turn-helix transcriptional regulator [Pseudomonas putida]NTZ53571.1 helix-turn-helix transcriptional regulator [Pseudomonas putida]NTZ64790.1 helix-turn-helix transcriptional regulator [Pseudomonas putida]
MELSIAFGLALKKVRNSRNLTQEDFSTVSSRTYLSSLERGLKSPTLEKINQLAGTLDVHPLTILVATYVARDANLDIEGLFQTIKDELAGMSSFQDLSQ